MKCEKHNLDYKYICPECLSPYLKNTSFSSLEEIREYQKINSKKINITDQKYKIKTVTCMKIRYFNNLAYAGSLFYDIKKKLTINFEILKFKESFPYFPTILFLRDLKIYLNLAEQIKYPPDCYLINASGQLHPYLFGVASDFGLNLKLKVPVIGVTKKNLCRNVIINNLKGLNGDKIAGDVLFENKLAGKYLSHKNLKRGIYVSVGNNISLNSALNTILKMVKYRVPEPIRLISIELNKFIKKKR